MRNLQHQSSAGISQRPNQILQFRLDLMLPVILVLPQQFLQGRAAAHEDCKDGAGCSH